MQLRDGVGATRRYRWGNYPMVRIALDGLADKIGVVNEAIRTLSRQLVDLQISVEDALRDRDQIDGELNELARSVRHQLQVAGSAKDEPYLSILPNGIGEYVEAKDGDELKAYGLLVSRMEEHLDHGDPIRGAMVPKLQDRLTAYEAAVKAETTATQAVDAGVLRCALAVAAWETAIPGVHAGLPARTKSRKRADRFFPRAGRSAETAEAAQAMDEPATGSSPDSK